jgi:Membrane-bound lysozyme-inhibitor of c-type lysozyme
MKRSSWVTSGFHEGINVLSFSAFDWLNGANMKRCNKIVLGKIILGMAVAGMAAGLAAAFAQTFQTYHCADGTQFIVGFYPHDLDAYLQIDGRPVILKKRLALFGARYWGSGVALRMTRDGRTLVRRVGRRETACQPS